MQDQKIDGGKPFDWGLTSADYAKYRDIYPDVLYQTLYEMGIGGPGQRILDIGPAPPDGPLWRLFYWAGSFEKTNPSG